MKINKSDFLEIFENAISWVVVFNMCVYGFSKVVQFDGAANFDKPVTELTGMELMWAFYGYSKTFALIIGAFEVTGAILILVKRTRILGCLFTTTILVNIIIQDIVYGVNQGALRAAIFYQFLILVILFLNKEKVFSSLKMLLDNSSLRHPRNKKAIMVVIAFSLFVVLRILEYYITIKI